MKQQAAKEAEAMTPTVVRIGNFLWPDVERRKAAREHLLSSPTFSAADLEATHEVAANTRRQEEEERQARYPLFYEYMANHLDNTLEGR